MRSRPGGRQTPRGEDARPALRDEVLARGQGCVRMTSAPPPRGPRSPGAQVAGFLSPALCAGPRRPHFRDTPRSGSNGRPRGAAAGAKACPQHRTAARRRLWKSQTESKAVRSRLVSGLGKRRQGGSVSVHPENEVHMHAHGSRAPTMCCLCPPETAGREFNWGVEPSAHKQVKQATAVWWAADNRINPAQAEQST